MPELAGVLPFLLIALLFWFLIIRPASRRQKSVREMQAGLAVGDDVMLTSGFYARIVELEDDAAVIELAPGTQVKVVRGAIGSVVPVVTDVGGVRRDADDH